MKSVQLLAISPSCVEAVNRAVYRLLATHYKIDVHMVIPKHNRIGAEFKMCLPVVDEPFAVTLLVPVGPLGRLQRLKGLPELIRTTHPSHILVEADPASLLMREVTRSTQDSPTKIWALTAENLTRNYLWEGFEGLRRGQLIAAASGFINFWLWRSSRRGIHHVFTISQHGTHAMSQLGFAGRITQIPLGFDPHLFYPKSPDQIEAVRRRLSLRVTTIAYFGRLLPEKGVDLLLQALAKLKDLPWQFLVDKFSTYQSPYVLKLQHQIETLGLIDRVIYFDAAHSEIPDYMNAADIIVLPSVSTPKWKEQYGRVIPEAMACGKIVIGSQSGAIPELIGDCGFLFPEGDIEALTDRLHYLLTAPADELREIQTKAAHRAHTHLSIFRQADVLAKMLNEKRYISQSQN